MKTRLKEVPPLFIYSFNEGIGAQKRRPEYKRGTCPKRTWNKITMNIFALYSLLLSATLVHAACLGRVHSCLDEAEVAIPRE